MVVISFLKVCLVLNRHYLRKNTKKDEVHFFLSHPSSQWSIFGNEVTPEFNSANPSVQLQVEQLHIQMPLRLFMAT